MRSLVFRLAMLCAGLLLMPQTIRAQSVIFVDISATGPTYDGTSWCSAYTSLTTALGNAVTGDEIRVADGLYLPGNIRSSTFRIDTNQNGVALLGGFAGCGAANPDDRHIRQYETILSCDLNGNDLPGFINNGENCYHVVTASFRDLSTVIDGFTITGGNANIPPPGTDDRGGGVINKSPLGRVDGPTIRNCIIRGNSALDKGGGMYNDKHNVSLINCLIVGNRAIFAGGIDNFDAFPIFTNCTIAYNSADGDPDNYQQGGIRDGGGSTSTMNNCILWGNSDQGGMDESAQYVTGMFIRPPLSHTTIQGFSARFFDGPGVNGVDPQFVDPFGLDGVAGTDDDDWRLASTSPANNTGDPAFVSPIGADMDLDFTPRLQSCRVDRGPFESAALQLANDYNADDAVDLADYADFQRCFATFPATSPNDEVCLCVFDDNADADVSLEDLYSFHDSITGP